MTNCPTFKFAFLRSTLRPVLFGLAVAGLAGCSSINSSFGSLMEPDRIDYKSAGKAPSLEVPPDLTQLQRENRYALPDASRGTATASGFNSAQPAGAQAAPATVAVKAVPDMRVERDGSQRWLVVKQTPEKLWPEIKDFWQDSGFLISTENAEAGVMETDWAENRAKIPQDFIRNTIGKALDALYSTSERDKFRTRLERNADGTTDIFISHRGAEEVLTGQQSERTIWTARPADPQLEAEFLSRLMARLGSTTAQAKAAVNSAVPMQSRARVVKAGNNEYVQIDEGFDRAWRRVGLALDRVGFTVEDRDRTQGLYFVRYVAQNQDAQNKSEKGFFAKMFSFGSKDDKGSVAQRYRVSVKGNDGSSQVAVLNNDGKPDTSQVGNKILGLLGEQLK
jgi:outer membrane protein assembly factor BamC